jgi:hypothetical protein
VQRRTAVPNIERSAEMRYGLQMTLETELTTLNASLFYKPLSPEHLVAIIRALASRES